MIQDHLKDKHRDMDINGNESLIDFSVISFYPDLFMRQMVESVRIQDTLEKGELKIGKKTEKIASFNHKG